MKKIEKSKNQIAFTTEMEDSLANAIRRYVLHIPVMAIDDVELSRNDSALYDETIAHRLGLIPLDSEGSVNEKSEGKIDLDVKKEGIVYSNELKGNVKVVYDNIPITTLSKGQELKVTCFVKTGIGKEHAKFSPGLMFFREVSEIELDKELYNEIKKVVPEKEIKEKGSKIIVIDNGKKEFADVCEGISKKANKKFDTKPNGELVITVESFGQMSPENVFKKSISALKKDLSTFQKAIDKA